MISLEEMRGLEPALKNAPDKDVEVIRNLLYAHAQLALECFIEEKNGSKMSSLVPRQVEDNMKKLPVCKTEKQKKE